MVAGEVSLMMASNRVVGEGTPSPPDEEEVDAKVAPVKEEEEEAEVVKALPTLFRP